MRYILLIIMLLIAISVFNCGPAPRRTDGDLDYEEKIPDIWDPGDAPDGDNNYGYGGDSGSTSYGTQE